MNKQALKNLYEYFKKSIIEYDCLITPDKLYNDYPFKNEVTEQEFGNIYNEITKTILEEQTKELDKEFERIYGK